MAYGIETFAWDDDGNLLIKTYYPMPETVGSDSDPYAHLLEGRQQFIATLICQFLNLAVASAQSRGTE